MNSIDVETLVRDLSSGVRTRDPNAPKIAGPKPFIPRIVEPVQVRGSVSGSVKFHKWKGNKAHKFTVVEGIYTTVEHVNRMRSFKQDSRYHRRKSK
jgi:hypothetical protein